jgi:hypothetical protein
MVVYFQALSVAYQSGFALLANALSNGSTNYNGGPAITSPSIGMSIFLLILACALVVLTVPIGHYSVVARWGLVAGEVVLAICYVAYLSNPTNVSAWIFGLVLSVAVLVCHFWPSVQVAFAAAAAPSGASTSSSGAQELPPFPAAALAEQRAKAAGTGPNSTGAGQ